MYFKTRDLRSIFKLSDLCSYNLHIVIVLIAIRIDFIIADNQAELLESPYLRKDTCDIYRRMYIHAYNILALIFLMNCEPTKTWCVHTKK